MAHLNEGDSPSQRSTTPSDTRTSQRPSLGYNSETARRGYSSQGLSISPDSRQTSKSPEWINTDIVNENSPLIKPQSSSRDVSGQVTPLPRGESGDWEDESMSQDSRSSWYLFLLTIAIGGLQICWSVELSYGSPYLLGLGLSKSLLAFVWIAGPLSGTLVQPYVGVKSDQSRSRWGKRRPFMVGGAIATIISLVCLAWAREIVAGFLGVFGVDPTSHAVSKVTIVFAVIVVYVLDFAINVVQAAVRTFIVDNAPAHQQNDANAWASRISGVGNVLGYLSGYVHLPSILPFFGDTQFKVLCVIACIALGVTVAISCLSIRERDPRLEEDPHVKSGVMTFFSDLYHSMLRLPPQISKVCRVQFFAWIGWFPFLFYTTTFIAEIYADPFFKENPDLSREEIDAIWEQGTRLASFSLLIFAIVTFAASVFLPLFIQPTFRAGPPPLKTPLTPAATTPSAFSHADYFSSVSTTVDSTPPTALAHADSFTSVSTAVALRRKRKHSVKRLLSKVPSLRIPHFTLRRLYIISHLLFALATAMTPLVHDVRAATVLIAFIGIPWAVTNWAPYALIAAEISKREAIKRGEMRPAEDDADAQLLAVGEDPAHGADQAGVVLGIHNVAIAAPQIIATLASSAIFKLLQKPRGQPGDDSVGWVLRFGGVAALVAAWLARSIHEESG